MFTDKLSLSKFKIVRRTKDALKTKYFKLCRIRQLSKKSQNNFKSRFGFLYKYIIHSLYWNFIVPLTVFRWEIRWEKVKGNFKCCPKLLVILVESRGIEPLTSWLPVSNLCFDKFLLVHFTSFCSAFFTFQFIRLSFSFAEFVTFGTQLAHKTLPYLKMLIILGCPWTH